MTITYSDKVIYLLSRWRGSVWKTVWKQLLTWLIIWYILYFVFKFVPWTEVQKDQITNTVKTFSTFCDGLSLPLVFILGFYVSQVVTRWWSQFQAIPWPDDSVVVANSYLFDDDHIKAVRESVARWLVLCEAMVFRQVSSRVHKRFPQLDNLVDAGLMTKQELLLLRRTRCKNTRWQMPLDWIVDKVIYPSEVHPIVKVTFVNSVNAFRNGLRQLFMYDWVGIPLVYTQTVAVVVYGYFAFAEIGHQYYGKPIDLYFPWLTVLQFIFYLGWLNVARELMHPFGDDDDDIELNCILDRHAAVAFSLATEVREESPDIIFDQTIRQELGQKMANCLTYSVISMNCVNHPPKLRGCVKVNEESQHKQLPKQTAPVKSSTFVSKLSKTNMPTNFF